MAKQQIKKEQVALTPTTVSNSGTAGGNISYIRLGDIVIAWGKTANYPSSSSVQTRTIVFPSGLFGASSVMFTGSSFYGGSFWEYAAFNSGTASLTSSNTTLGVTQSSTSGSAVQGACSWIVIGSAV